MKLLHTRHLDSSPVIPAPPKLEVAQVVSKPVAQSRDKMVSQSFAFVAAKP